MDTPPRNSKKPELEDNTFDESGMEESQPLPFDMPDDLREQQENWVLDERIREAEERAKQQSEASETALQRKIDALISEVNRMSFDGYSNFPSSPAMYDSRDVMAARGNMDLFFRSPPRSTAAAYDFSTPPAYGLQTSRMAPIGTGRPSSFTSSKQTSNIGHNSFNASNNFHSSNGILSSAFIASNRFNSSAFNHSSGSDRRRNDSYKTALCSQYKQTKTCTYGSECKYAHGVDELRTPPCAKPNYKTVLCRNFLADNYCPHGSRCKFIHRHRREEDDDDEDDIPYRSPFNFSTSRGRHR